MIDDLQRAVTNLRGRMPGSSQEMDGGQFDEAFALGDRIREALDEADAAEKQATSLGHDHPITEAEGQKVGFDFQRRTDARRAWNQLRKWMDDRTILENYCALSGGSLPPVFPDV